MITLHELKTRLDASNHNKYYFSKDTMKFFGDHMSNYGVKETMIKGIKAIELYRIKPVKGGHQESAYFHPETLKTIYIDG